MTTNVIADKVKPFHIKSKQANIDLKTKKVVSVLGPIDAKMVSLVQRLMMLTDSLEGPRVLVIDSPGGYTGAGNDIIDLIAYDKKLGNKVICIVVHHAESMAFNILSHCDVRLSFPAAQFMFHKVALYDLDRPESGRLTEVKLLEIAKDLANTDKIYDTYNAKVLGMDLDTYNKNALAEQIWTASELYQKKVLACL